MKVAGASRRSNVAMSPRRDVSTSRRWVHQYNSQQAVTSRRRNVATSQRHNVATSARDFPSIIKSSKGSEFKEDGGGVQTRAWNSRAAATPTSKKSP